MFGQILEQRTLRNIRQLAQSWPPFLKAQFHLLLACCFSFSVVHLNGRCRAISSDKIAPLMTVTFDDLGDPHAARDPIQSLGQDQVRFPSPLQKSEIYELRAFPERDAECPFQYTFPSHGPFLNPGQKALFRLLLA